MKKLLTIFLVLCSFLVKSQTTPFTFTVLPNDYLRPNAGAMNWNDAYDVSVPPGNPTGALAGIDRYCRFTWSQVENDNGTFNLGNGSPFIQRLQIAITNHQTWSFGIMPYCEGCGTGSIVNGVTLNYPLSLHTAMQAEAVKDFQASDIWIPNWNSPTFLSRWKAMLMAIANVINTGSFNGVLYKNVVSFVDVRGYGNFGEWHNFPYTGQPGYPAAIIPTTAVLDSIIQTHIDAFPNYPLTILIGAFDPVDGINMPPAVTYFALTAKNNWGEIGWRRDNWGDEVNYVNVLENNPGSFNGLTFKTAIMSKSQRGEITGEPLNGGPTGGSPATAYGGLVVEMPRYGCDGFGNSNMSNVTNGTVIANVQNASKISGHRMGITDGSISTILSPGNPFTLSMNWKNFGVCPVYEDVWTVQYELRSGTTTVVQTWTSSLNLKLFQVGTQTINDVFTINAGVAIGNYNLYVIVRDKLGYRAPYPLNQGGRGTDGAYLVKAVTLTSGVIVTPNPPKVSAGLDQTIVLGQPPATGTVTLTATASPVAPGNSIAGFVWTKFSGGAATITNNASATTTVTQLVAGQYKFVVRATDNLGVTSTDTVIINVNAPHNPCNCVTGGITGNKYKNGRTGPGSSYYEIILPDTTCPNPKVSAGVTVATTATSASLKGTASSNVPGGTIKSIIWTQMSGAKATINNFGTLTPTITGLTAGTYVFNLSVTDQCNLTSNSQVTIKVTAAPTKVLIKGVYVPAQNELDLTYSDGSLVYVRLLTNTTVMWVENDYPTHTCVVWYNNGTKATYQ